MWLESKFQNKLIVTAGSGPSYSKWPHWPTWTKMLPMMYRCRHIDVSGPAAGNKFLSRAVITKLAEVQPDLVLMQWNLGKFDIYCENEEFSDLIVNGKGIRNFLLDIHTGKTTTGPGYWCSSHDNTVEWKKYYNENIKSITGTALDDLEAMLNLQNLCAKRNIIYKFFTHDDIDHEFLSTNKHTLPFYKEIDWNAQVFDSVRTMYKNHSSFEFDTSGSIREFHWVPNADFQYFFLTEKLSTLMGDLGITNRSFENLQDYCHSRTVECYEQSKTMQ
jgi:hypothetical protein